MRLSVGTKLLGGFGVVIALTAVIGILAISNLAALSDLTGTMHSRELVAVLNIGDARAAAFTHRLATVQLIDARDAAEQERQQTRRREAEASFKQALAALQPRLISPETRALFSQIEAAWPQYASVADQAAALVATDRATAEQLNRTTGRERGEALDALLTQLRGAKSRLAEEEAQGARQTYESIRNLTLALLLGALITGLLVALWLSRAITVGLRATAQTAALIAAGDLTRAVPIRSRDEIGDLGLSFNRMLAGLQDVTSEIRDGAQSLAAATSEILASVTQQGASATEQAAAVSQTTATVDEVRVTAQQATQRAQAVAETAHRAAEVGAQGLATVEATVAGMREMRTRVESIAEQILALSEQTQQIGEIIATVEDLADKSDLLAVNAAVEAARAGDQGRGFAVVAQEVRSLSERSKAATIQVRTILTDIQRATNAAVLATEQGTRGAEDSARLVEQAGQAIRQLEATIRESAEAARQIVASAGQQGAGMDQIAAAMTDINQATGESAAGTRQLQKAAENLSDLAQRLTDLVSRYKLNGRV